MTDTTKAPGSTPDPETLSTAATAKADKGDKGGPYVALSPIRHGQTVVGANASVRGGPTTPAMAETRYMPGETIDIGLFSAEEVAQLKTSKSIGTKEDLVALNKDVVEIGKGDGKTTTFDTPFARSATIEVYVDGVAVTKNVRTLAGAGARGTEKVSITPAPISGAVITARPDAGAVDLTKYDANTKTTEAKTQKPLTK